MILLLDKSPDDYARRSVKYDFIRGQLLTPLTRYRNAGVPFAIDNGAFSKFERDGFLRLLERERANRESCLFVALPDVVGSARRTLEAFEVWAEQIGKWPLALVCQDGQEDLPIPWKQLAAVFVGGSTEFKLSKSAEDIIKTAQILGKHTHVGRVNTAERWFRFEELGVDTCDGSGASRYDWMLDAIAEKRRTGNYCPLFDSDIEPTGGVGSESLVAVRSISESNGNSAAHDQQDEAHAGIDGPVDTCHGCTD